MELVSRYNALNTQLTGGKEVTGILVTRKHRYEETGRVTVEAKDCNRIEKFIEKPIVELESPEALGIYLFSKKIFEYLHQQNPLLGTSRPIVLTCHMMSWQTYPQQGLICIPTILTKIQIG